MGNYLISIEGLRLYAFHGLFDEEAKLGQQFEIDLCLRVKSPEKERFEVGRVLDYAQVVKRVSESFTKNRFGLLEEVAVFLLEDLSGFSVLEHANIKIKKLAPPIPAHLKSVGVEMERTY